MTPAPGEQPRERGNDRPGPPTMAEKWRCPMGAKAAVGCWSHGPLVTPSRCETRFLPTRIDQPPQPVQQARETVVSMRH
jgi:hypothetical protein